MSKKRVSSDQSSYRDDSELPSAGNCEQPRRRLLQYLTAAGAIVTAKALPNRWTKPVIDSIILPAHAQASPAVVGFSGAGILSISRRDDDIKRLYAMQPEKNHSLLDLLIPKAQASEESMIFATYYLSPEDVLTYKNAFVFALPCSELNDATNPENIVNFTLEMCWEGTISKNTTNIPFTSCFGLLGSAPARIVEREPDRVLVEVFGEREYLEPGGSPPTCECVDLDDFENVVKDVCGVPINVPLANSQTGKKFDPLDFLPPRYK